MKRLVILSLISLLLVACKEPTAVSTPNHSPAEPAHVTNQDERFIARHKALKTKNPHADVQTAIQRGERYFLCGIGRGASVPGIPAAAYQAVRNNCPTRCLEGVSDAIYGQHHLAYLETAERYSSIWNQTMLTACR